MRDFNIKTTAVVAGISREHGLEPWLPFERSVNT